MTSKEEIQKKYMEMKMLQEQMQQMQQQQQAVEQKVGEIEAIQSSLDEFKHAKKDSDILVHLAEGIFAKASLKDNNKLLINVGANTVVAKTVPEVKALLNKQEEEIRKLHMELTAGLGQLAEKAVPLEQELQKLISEQKE